MKLSEAIHAGCRMKPEQGFGSHSIKTTEDKVCVLGAAGCGAGMVNDNVDRAFGNLRREFPILGEKVAELPPGVGWSATSIARDRRLQTICWFLNDVEKWPREKIADFIEEIEQEIDECGLKGEQSSGL